jgi:stalled ribosome rescue protein Dom34
MLHVVWMDSVHADVYLLHPNGTFEHKHVVRHDQDHHTHSHRDEKHPPEKFYKDLSQVIVGAEEILLTGPGLGKEHFRAYLEKHHAKDLGQHIVGMETVDHPTEPQIKARAVQVFKQRHPHFPVN